MSVALHRTRRQALKWSFILNWSTKGITIASMFVLARILGPEIFGVSALAMVLVALIELVVDSGLAQAVVQQRDIREEDLDSLFWFTAVVSIILSWIGYLGADALAWACGEPEVSLIFATLSPLVIMKGLGVIQQGLARRELRFKELALRGTLATGLGSLVAVICAVIGFGVWSLVLQYLVTEFVGLILLWRLSKWRPQFRFEWRRAKSFFHFSSGVLLAQLGAFVGNQSDVFVTGAFFGPTAVGVLRLANRLVNLFVDMLVRPVQAIALPRLAALRGDVGAIQIETLKLMRISTLLLMPCIAVAMVGAEAVTSILGPNWKAATWSIQILAIVGIAKSLTLLTGPAMLALGRSHTVALGSWIQGAVMVVALLIAGLAAEKWSESAQITLIAAARSAVFVLLVVPIQVGFMSRATGTSLIRICRTILPGVLAMVITLSAGFALRVVLESSGIGSPSVAAWTSAVGSGLLAFVMVHRSTRTLRGLRTPPQSRATTKVENSNLERPTTTPRYSLGDE